jgi:hypothetical protein
MVDTATTGKFVRETRSKGWIVGLHCSSTNENCVSPIAQDMSMATGVTPSNPPALSGPRGDPTVQGHGVLCSNQRTSGAQPGEEAGVQLCRLALTEPHLNRDSRLPETLYSLPLDVWVGITNCDNTSLDTGPDDGLHTWWCPAVMAARL